MEEGKSKTGWGFTKLPTAQRDKPQLHYFNDGRSLCHGTAPVQGQTLTTSTANWPRERTCNACVGKRRALENKRAKKGAAK